jgi:hypothetical protein
MNYKRITITNGSVRAGRGDRQCKRSACVYPQPTICLDLDGRRITAAWSWLDVQVLTIPTGVRVQIVPALLLVPISRN